VNGVLAEVWSEVLGNPRCRYFGGFVCGELVSSCTIMVIPNLTRGARPYGLIENVVTHQEHRGQGYGKALLAQALEFGWSQQCYKVMLMTGRKDDATHHFYESAGFDPLSKKAFTFLGSGPSKMSVGNGEHPRPAMGRYRSVAETPGIGSFST
jgi:GNAT superfamily N-acetyltransferase